MARDVLCARKHIVHAIRSESVFLGERLVANPQLLCGDRASRLVAEKDYLCVWMHERPAFQGVSLDDPAMTYEWLSGSEEGDHRNFGASIVQQT